MLPAGAVAWNLFPVESRAVPWIVAHRGASRDAPENTLAAVRLAWEQGADAVEVDLRLTRDGEIVALHDPTTHRTTGVDLTAARSTLAELRALDAGSCKDARFRGEPIPTLRETLASVPAGRRIVLELKDGPELLAPLCRDLATSASNGGPAPDRVVLITFQEVLAQLAKARLGGASVLWLGDARHPRAGEDASATMRRMITTAGRAGLNGVDLRAHPRLDAGLVDEAHASGLLVFVWTVNDPAEARRLRQAGVDAITTDVPATLAAHLRG